ncbi:MAG: DsbA family oxidoreductase [Pseudomonadota bacterium]
MLTISIVSDVVCPWCYVAYKQLRQALDARELNAAIVWEPFELNPWMSDQGQEIQEHLAMKYGPGAASGGGERMRALGEELGITFNRPPDMRIYNTLKAHQLLHWADGMGKQHALKMALFHAYFTDNRNISDLSVLTDIAESVGLDAKEATDIANGEAERLAVQDRIEEFARRGIMVVPTMIFNNKRVVSGAQGVDGYGRLLDKLTAATPA